MDARRVMPGRIAAVAVLCLFLLTGAAGAGTVELKLEACARLRSFETPIEVTTRPAGKEADPVSEPVVPSVELPESATRLPLALEPGSWRVEIRNPAFWTRPLTVTEGADTVAVPLWPRSTVRGVVEVPRGEERPAALRVRLEVDIEGKSRDDSPCALWQATTRCGVDAEEGAFACAVPAGRWDVVTVDAYGWTPRRLPGRTLKPGHSADLGAVTLRRGATLMGQLITAHGAADPETARLWVVPARDARARFDPDDLRRRWKRHMLEIGDHGEFAAHDLAPGTYLVVAHQPGFAVNDTTLVTLEGTEQRLLRDPVVLTPPLRLLVELAPPLDPFGEPWEVRLSTEGATGGGLGSVSSGAAVEGRWRSEAVPPGEYYLALYDAGDNRWLMEGPFHLDAGDGPEVYVPLSVGVVEVEGTVRLGDDPVAHADLWFGGRNGMTSIEASTDEDGRYRAALPRAGEWEVELEAEEPPLSYRDGVDVPERGGRLDVELPDTRLSGRVVSADGGVPGPRTGVVTLRLDDSVGMNSVPVLDDGSFEVRGLATGTYRVWARNDEGASDAVQVTVTEDYDPPDLTLVLRREASVEGEVVSEHGGVEGAWVLGVPVSATGRILQARQLETRTGPQGRFRLGVPLAASTLELRVLPPGFGLTVVRRPLDHLRVPVAPAEASLRLPGVGQLPDGLTGVLMIGGMPVHVSTLAKWATMNGAFVGSGAEPWRLPAVPSGAYRFCLVALTEAEPLFAGRAVPTRCSEGAVPPGGELTLTMP